MNTGTKITVFAAGLAVVFAAAYGVGTVVDPLVAGAEPAAHGSHDEEAAAHRGGEDDPGGDHEAPSAGGLQVSEGGYSLDLKTPRLAAGKQEELRFTILREDGRPVTGFRREHGKDLHLILASRDLGTYRHLHPKLSPDGIWSTGVELPRAGDYRLFADFVPEAENGTGLTLGADVAVSGDYNARKLPEESATATVDGYTVTLDGELAAGKAREVRLTVEKNGKPVTDLEPYLGAYGHLVALRSGDLAYLHVHPNGEPGDGSTEPGPGISFTATAPSIADYRLFLDFKHMGKVRTAMFTVKTAQTPGTSEDKKPTEGAKEADEHRH